MELDVLKIKYEDYLKISWLTVKTNFIFYYNYKIMLKVVSIASQSILFILNATKIINKCAYKLLCEYKCELISC